MIGEKKEQPQNCIPEVDKYCGIFITFGERRLGTHLLAGFLSALRAIVSIALTKYEANEDTLKEVLELYPGSRKVEGIESCKIVPQLDPPFINGLEQNVNVWCKEPIHKEEDYNKLVLYAKLIDKIEMLKKFKEASEQVEEWGAILLNSLPETQQKLMQNKLNQLVIEYKKSGKSPLEHLIDIYVRIGYETGLVKRVMQEADINWGTFVGHSPISFHCNAHANNFVVLPPVIQNNKYRVMIVY